MKKIFAAAMLLLMMTACCGTKGPALEGTTWKLLEMNGQRDAALFNAVADDFTFTLDPAELRISGKTNCNRFFGSYTLSGSEIDIESVGMTRMACPGMEYEAAFVAMLDEVDDFKIKGSELTFSDDGKVLAIFTAIPAVKQE